MRLSLLAMTLVWAVLAAPVDAAPVTTATPALIDEALGAIVQADGVRAAELLRTLSKTTLSDSDAQWLACASARLSHPADGESGIPDAFSRQVLEAYEDYWRLGVTNIEARKTAEVQLLTRLRRLLGDDGIRDVATAEPALTSRLEQAGYHSLQGMTGVLHELMIWSSQTEQRQHVVLPEGEQFTSVFLLDGFLSRGWSAYLTCGRSGTGGWTTPAGLYAVVPAYESLTDENFSVGFVAHESQHFADQQRFPELQPWEKEYRAKLVELALADASRQSTLRYFLSSQGDDPADAHSYANKRVLESVRRRLALRADQPITAVPMRRLQRAAVAELRADSRRHRQSRR